MGAGTSIGDNSPLGPRATTEGLGAGAITEGLATGATTEGLGAGATAEVSIGGLEGVAFGGATTKGLVA